MISSIEGILAEKRDMSVVVETGGFGLEIHVPAPAVEGLGKVGEAVRLETYLHVREDTLALYGFSSAYERTLFLSLLGVSGVGPKAALTIMSHDGAGTLARMIRGEDVKSLVRIPGIGKKTAERIVVELKDKIELEGAPERAGAPRAQTGALEEAVAALMSLGLTRSNAEKALDRVRLEEGAEEYKVEDIVRMALRKVPL